MPSPYLSKSDFKAAFDCRTKLYYRKNRYPSNLDENEYVQFLADGGFMIEAIAKARYPQGHDLGDNRDHQAAFKETQALLATGDVVIFEAAAIFEKLLVRTDILRREGGTLHLVEVKSSSINAAAHEDNGDSPFLGQKGENKGKVTSRWKPYLVDVAYQAHVLRRAFPAFRVVPWLCVVDKSRSVEPCETLAPFRLSRDNTNPRARPTVTYAGDVAALAKSKVVVPRDVSFETGLLMEEVEQKAAELSTLIDIAGKVLRVQEDIADGYKDCRTCEYRFAPERAPSAHGFAECWGDLAKPKPHILDLHRVTQIGSSKTLDPVPGLLKRGRAGILDLAATDLGAPGARQMRRQMQWKHSQDGGREHLPQALKDELRSHLCDPGEPLLFLDFEACNVALPHHAGLRPYERIAFQWSCHRITRDGSLSHAEWLNTERDFPNFAFAESLRRELGNKGTIYVWSPYEESTLRRILLQIGEWTMRDAAEAVRAAKFKSQSQLDDLADWILDLVGSPDGERLSSGRIRDLHKLCLDHYFHPEMLGRTSIKVVLPAVWRANPQLRSHPWFAAYGAVDEKGNPLDPYKTLPPLPLGDEDGSEDAVIDGTGAIRVYQDLIFCQDDGAEFRSNRQRLLKQYCCLDTLAMVMIWKHWTA